MAQPDTALDLDDLFDAVEASIGAEFPDLQLCEAYPADLVSMPTPACIIELQELEPTDNPGTGQLAAIATLQALVLVGFREPNAKRSVAKLAAAVAQHVQGQRWGLPVEPAVVTAIAPDDFDPELDQFEVWAVEWRQTVHIGASIWGDDGTTPTQILASWAPEIGPAHEGDYIPLDPTTGSTWDDSAEMRDGMTWGPGA